MEEEFSSPPATQRGRQDSLHLTCTVQSPPPVILVNLQPSVSSVGKKKMRLRLSPFFPSSHEEASSDGELDRLTIPRRSRFFRKRKDEHLAMLKTDSVSLTDLDSGSVVRPLSTPNVGMRTPSLNPKTPGVLFRKQNNDLDRRVPCIDLGGGDCEGWLMKKREGGSGRSTKKWVNFWFVLKHKNLYYFVTREDTKAQGVIYLPGFKISPAPEVKSKKFAFKAHHTGTTFYFASECQDEMTKWMNKMGIASLGNLELSNSLTTAGFTKIELFSHRNEDGSDANSRCSSLYSEESDEDSMSGASSLQISPSSSLAGSREDITDLYRNIRRADLDLSGMNVKVKRSSIFVLTTGSTTSFNECYLRLNSLQRTLKDKENALATIETLLQHGNLTSEILHNFVHQHTNIFSELDTVWSATSPRQSNISEENFGSTSELDTTKDDEHRKEYDEISQELRGASSQESVASAAEPEVSTEVSPSSEADDRPTLVYGMSMIEEGLGSSNRLSVGNALTISFTIDTTSES